MTDTSDAVSPVIGVMLMIVVTIIIAAVVSGFASGIVDSQKDTSQAQVRFVGPVFDPNWGGLRFENSGGEDVDLRYMGIHLMEGNTQAEFTSRDVLAKSVSTKYVYPGMACDYPENCLSSEIVQRFEKVGDSSHLMYIVQPGEQFMVYADSFYTNANMQYLGFKIFRDDTVEYSSIGLFSGRLKQYTLYDTRSGKIYASGDIYFPYER
ncbi:MAG: type IV pilin N-terminal domain-containing protein [Methanoregula sp.]|jgi:hypothetical protein